MKKSEVKAASNAELITELCKAHMGDTVTKKDKADVRYIVTELAERGIISSDEAERMHCKFDDCGNI